MRQIFLGLILTTKLFGQSDSLETRRDLSKLTFSITQQLYKQGLTNFFIIRQHCIGETVVSRPYDSCNDKSNRHYILYNLTKDSVTVITFGVCGQSKKPYKISADLLTLFVSNREKIKREEFKFKSMTDHPCIISFYEFANKRLWTKKWFADFMITNDKNYSKTNKELLTYKLLNGLMTELRNINGS